MDSQPAIPQAWSAQRVGWLGPLLGWARKRRSILVPICVICILLGALADIVLSNIPSGPTVIARGQVAGHAWRLIAQEQGGQLSMEMVGKSTTVPYSGSVGFNKGGAAGYWEVGPGPADSMFYYGPAPNSVDHVILTAPGYKPVVVRTVPLPRNVGLPSGRFFIADPPGPASVIWNVSLRDSAGNIVPFQSFLRANKAG